MLTPYQVHYKMTDKIISQRNCILEKAYYKHPERFVKGIPKTEEVPKAVWINKPETEKNIYNKSTLIPN